MVIRKAQFVLLLAVWGLGHAAAAEDADDYRGGWRTDKGEAHTYEFSIRGDTSIALIARMRRRWLLWTASSGRTASVS